jgi:predicted glycosyltransferase
MSLRVLISVTHLLGAGHLTRAAALARAFARAGHQTTLASGGMPAPLIRTDGVRLVQLPPVRTAGTDFTTLLDESGQPVVPARLEARREMLLDLIDAAPPDVVLTELFPFGRRALAGEFMALVEHAKAVRPDALVVASVRDILVAPAKHDRIAAAHATLKRSYGAVLVHGDADLVPLDASWPLDEGTGALLRYTGYVDDGAPVASPPPDGRSEVVVSGGSSAASLPLYRAAIAAASLVREHRWRILVGAAVAEAQFASLSGAALPNIVVERARSDFRGLLAGAAVSVSQAGYNTVVDVLRACCPAVFVPFAQGSETEQRLRAERLAARGLGEVLAETDLSPASLAEAVRRAARQQQADHELDLKGTEHSVAIIEELAGKRSNPALLSQAPRSSLPWHLLYEALTRSAERHEAVQFWWRDDDAVAHTPSLDRLFKLAHAYGIPIAIASIPKLADDSLAARLAGEPLARILVHGLAHTNHAPENRKKAEFGSDRPLPHLVDDARDGLRLAKARFGDALLPVFVPPWNRVSPDLMPELPKLGFRGLSTFGRRSAHDPAPGLVQANTHLDPIDWHAGGGLRPVELLIAELAAAITAQGEAENREPIGLLTHHLVQDEATWGFCDELLVRLAGNAMVRFPDPRGMFAGAQTFAPRDGDLPIRLS